MEAFETDTRAGGISVALHHRKEAVKIAFGLVGASCFSEANAARGQASSRSVRKILRLPAIKLMRSDPNDWTAKPLP